MIIEEELSVKHKATQALADRCDDRGDRTASAVLEGLLYVGMCIRWAATEIAEALKEQQ